MSNQPKTGIIEHEPQVPVSDSAAIISVIERAALNPEVDIDKMERLLEMHQRMQADAARKAYAVDLSLMQPDLPAVSERGKIRNKQGGVQSTYALWEDVNDAIKPVLKSHGFALSFRSKHENGQIIVTGVLCHRDGHSEETSIPLPHDNSGSKNAVQAIGSSISYGKRYTAGELLNLTSRGEDDDGEAGGANAISADQFMELQNLIEEVGADLDKFIKYMGVKHLEELPAVKFAAAKASLNAKRAK